MDDADVTNVSGAPAGSVTIDVSNDPPPWDAYLACAPGATLLHDPRWGLVMREAYGNRPYYLTARRGGEVAGVLQLVLQRSLLFGTHLASLPYFDAAGTLADDGTATDALLAEAAHHPDGRFRGSPGHVRDLMAGEGQRGSKPGRQHEQHAGDSLLHPLHGDVTQAALRVPEPAAEDVDDPESDLGTLGEEGQKALALDPQHPLFRRLRAKRRC